MWQVSESGDHSIYASAVRAFTVGWYYIDAVVEPSRGDVQCAMSLTGSQSSGLLKSFYLSTSITQN